MIQVELDEQDQDQAIAMLHLHYKLFTTNYENFVNLPDETMFKDVANTLTLPTIDETMYDVLEGVATSMLGVEIKKMPSLEEAIKLLENDRRIRRANSAPIRDYFDKLNVGQLRNFKNRTK